MNPNLKYDAPPYDIVIASTRVGVNRPEDSPWVKRSGRRLVGIEGPYFWTLCLCKKLQTFTSPEPTLPAPDQSEKIYLKRIPRTMIFAGQCPECGTVYWVDAS